MSNDITGIVVSDFMRILPPRAGYAAHATLKGGGGTHSQRPVVALIAVNVVPWAQQLADCVGLGVFSSSVRGKGHPS